MAAQAQQAGQAAQAARRLMLAQQYRPQRKLSLDGDVRKTTGPFSAVYIDPLTKVPTHYDHVTGKATTLPMRIPSKVPTAPYDPLDGFDVEAYLAEKGCLPDAEKARMIEKRFFGGQQQPADGEGGDAEIGMLSRSAPTVESPLAYLAAQEAALTRRYHGGALGDT